MISLNSLIWKTKSTNKYWFENPSTNSTNQRIKFSLICKNVNEFSTKIPINPPNVQRIMRHQWQFSKHRPISNKISTNSKIFFRWFRWFVEFVEKINENKKQQISFENSSTEIKNNEFFLSFLEPWSELPLNIDIANI